MSDTLQHLLEEGVIDGVLGTLKTGKEAEVYLVEHAGEVVAAKVYKERHERNFRNNAGYREGRAVRNTRTQRAMDRGSKFGQAAAEEAWKSAEADALYKLHAAGVRVPTPVMFFEGVLLMQLVVDAEGHPAPRLVDAQLTPEGAEEMYRDLRGQVIKMLCQDLIHGDLSPYNVLLGGEGPVIIDFPQIISAAHNSRAEFFFRRDLDNLRTHFEGFSPALRNTRAESSEIWRAHTRRELTPDFVPVGLPEPRESGRPQRQQRDGGGFQPRRDGQGGGHPRRDGQGGGQPRGDGFQPRGDGQGGGQPRRDGQGGGQPRRDGFQPRGDGQSRRDGQPRGGAFQSRGDGQPRRDGQGGGGLQPRRDGQGAGQPRRDGQGGGGLQPRREVPGNASPRREGSRGGFRQNGPRMPEVSYRGVPPVSSVPTAAPQNATNQHLPPSGGNPLGQRAHGQPGPGGTPGAPGENGAPARRRRRRRGRGRGGSGPGSSSGPNGGAGPATDPA